MSLNMVASRSASWLAFDVHFSLRKQITEKLHNLPCSAFSRFEIPNTICFKQHAIVRLFQGEPRLKADIWPYCNLEGPLSKERCSSEAHKRRASLLVYLYIIIYI